MAKIFVIADGIPSDNSLLGIFEMEQAIALKNAGNEVYYIAFNCYPYRNKRKYGLFSGEYKGVQYLYKSFPLERHPLTFFANIAAYLFNNLINIAMEKFGNPDIVHSHFIFTNYIVAKNKNLFSCPLVITEHSSFINTKNIKPAYFKLGKYAYNKADAVISVSNALKQRIKEHFNVDSFVIPNILECNAFNYTQNNNRNGFVTASNLVEIKNIEFLIKTFHKAFDFSTPTYLHIYGDGEKKQELNELINTLGENERIKLMGMTSREELSQAYAKANAFIMLSRSETFGLAYVEAIASGLPVISTKCGGPEDFVNESNGVLLDLDDEVSTIIALKNFQNNKNKYDRNSISIDIKNKYKVESVVKEMEEVYKLLL